MRLLKHRDNSPSLRDASETLGADFKSAADRLVHDAGNVATAGAKGALRFVQEKKMHIIVGTVALAVGGLLGWILRRKM